MYILNNDECQFQFYTCLVFFLFVSLRYVCIFTHQHQTWTTQKFEKWGPHSMIKSNKFGHQDAPDHQKHITGHQEQITEQGMKLCHLETFGMATLKWTLVLGHLTHWGGDKMATIFQTTFSNEFSWMKMYEYRLKVHWSLFLRVQLTISQHWFR